MAETLHLFFNETYVGTVSYDYQTDTYTFTPKADPDAEELSCLDLWNLASNADKGPERFKQTLLNSRVAPKNQAGMDKTMKRLGMTQYDPWKLMKASHLQGNDAFWAAEEKDPNLYWIFCWAARLLPEYSEKIRWMKADPQYAQLAKRAPWM